MDQNALVPLKEFLTNLVNRLKNTNINIDEFEIVDTYIDDGISGMTYDRAAYSRMMEAINEGSINAIIVKEVEYESTYYWSF